MFVRKHQELLVHIRHKKATKSSGAAFQQGDQKKSLSMIPTKAFSMENHFAGTELQQQEFDQTKAPCMPLAKQNMLLEQEQEAAFQRQQLQTVSQPRGTSRASVTSYTRMTNARSLDASTEKGSPLAKLLGATSTSSTIGDDEAQHEAARRRQQQDLLALLNLALPQRCGSAVPSTKIQTAFLPREKDRNMMSQALLMSAIELIPISSNLPDFN
ncbi:unnamed protein product [Cylindrotheca closterium]|uniref:Uncharacterized protein n=1 Tax=Cylindrotheca closterium TaxID=2856 RepID=A0AAD2G5C6_9STRA|nr:unnamed protein product [Cylindrotheca closterium]